MESNFSYKKVNNRGKYTLAVNVTEQAKSLGIKANDKVLVKVCDGKIIIEKA